MTKNPDSVYKFLCAILATALLSSFAWWLMVGNKLNACEEAVKMRTEISDLRKSLDDNTRAVDQMSVVLRAYGITMENLAPNEDRSYAP